MSRVVSLFFAAVLALSLCAGCGPSGTPPIQTFEAPVSDPFAEAKAILTNYANGSPVTSEASSFDDLATRAKEKDAAKGEILAKGLNEIKAHPNNARAKAQELLKKL